MISWGSIGGRVVLALCALVSTSCLPVGISGKKDIVAQTRGDVTVLKSISAHAEADVIETSPNVASVRRVTDLPEGQCLGRICVTPDGYDLLMEIIEKPDYYTLLSNIWSLPLLGGSGARAIKRVTQGNYVDRCPSLDPGGQSLYFTSNRAGRNAIWRLSLGESGGLAMVTSSSTSDEASQVSPDGSTLAYTAYVGASQPQIWLMPLGKGHPTQLREGRDPRWSIDGKKILFTATRPFQGQQNSQIWVMNKDGSEPTQVTNGNSDDIHPQWSRDGKKMLFASNRGLAGGKKNYDIWVMHADGSNPVQLTTNGSRDDYPVWDVDGKTVYFRSNRGLKWDVWAMRLKTEPMPPPVTPAKTSPMSK